MDVTIVLGRSYCSPAVNSADLCHKYQASNVNKTKGATPEHSGYYEFHNVGKTDGISFTVCTGKNAETRQQ